MASETQCVNCIEPHNPTFDPNVGSTENGTALNDATEKVEISSVSNADVVPSTTKLLSLEGGSDDHDLKLTINFDGRSETSLAREVEPLCLGHGTNVEFTSSIAIRSHVEKETSHASPQHDIATQGQCIVVPQSSPPVSAPDQQLMQDTRRLSEILLAEKTSKFLLNDQPHTSHRSIETEHQTDVRESECTQKPQNSAISNQFDDDDEVQFILSVAKKKRRRRTRLDHLPLDGVQTSKVPTRNDSSEGTNELASQSKRANLQDTDLKSNSIQNTSHLKSGMTHSHDESSLKPAPKGTLACIDALQAASISEAPNIMKRKNRHDENDVLPGNSPVLPTSIVKNGSLSMGIPILHRHQNLPETFNSMKSFAKMQDGPGTNQAGTSQSAYRVEAPLLSRGPHLPQHKANSTQGHVYWQAGLAPGASPIPLISRSTSEGLRRRPSLYRIPQWHTSSPYSGIQSPARSADTTGSLHQSPYASKRGSIVDIPQIPFNGRVSEALPSAGSTIYNCFPSDTQYLQAKNIPKPTAPPAGLQDSQPKHPKNMLVDIAQTCQDNFPFALIAKRHNQPIQKVFDTFSAVIQLPLLRSAVDARRPGKLGSFRMKEFKEMKKQAKQLHKDKQARKGV